MDRGTEDRRLDQIAKRYVELVLLVGQKDSDLVDAYYGPDVLKEKAAQEISSLSTDKITNEFSELISELAVYSSSDKLLCKRADNLKTLLIATEAKFQICFLDRSYTFDEEQAALYDSSLPEIDEAPVVKVAEELEKLIPGKGNLVDRLEAFRSKFHVKPEDLKDVFSCALDACRSATRKYIELPEDDSFQIEYVNNQPWSAYNWYKGGAHSLIQVNTDFPVSVDRVLHLAAHEGYPGHHVMHSLLENGLYRKKTWFEFCINPLFSPLSFMAEGTANYGAKLVMNKKEKEDFYRQELFQRAKLDFELYEQNKVIQRIMKPLRYADLHCARMYLDGKWSKEQTLGWLASVSLRTPKQAQQRLAFIDKYRSYITNYVVGEDAVKNYVEQVVGSIERWERFHSLISSPWAPHQLT